MLCEKGAWQRCRKVQMLSLSSLTPAIVVVVGFFVIQMLGIFKRVTGRRGIKNVLLILTAAFHEIPGKKVLRVSLCVLYTTCCLCLIYNLCLIYVFVLYATSLSFI